MIEIVKPTAAEQAVIAAMRARAAQAGRPSTAAVAEIMET